MADADDPNGDLSNEKPLEYPNTYTEFQLAEKQKLLSRKNNLVRQKIRDLFLSVPPIGNGRRWYDAPYRLLSWLVRGRIRKILPRRIRQIFTKGMNFLYTFNHYDLLKFESREDPMQNLIIPEGEELTQGGLWVVEFFPPSHYASLHRSLRKNGWDQNSHSLDIYGSNAEQLVRARHGAGYSWARLGSVANSKSLGFFPDAKRENLPEEFSSVELTTVQIGRSLTAIVAFVRLSDLGQKSLDIAWKSKREPTLEWRGLRRPRVEGRLFAAFHATQRERQRIHDLARRWLTLRCAGFFSGAALKQPVVDFNVFSNFDPLADNTSSSIGDSLRALGLGANYLYNYISPQIPGAVIIPSDNLTLRGGILQNCWGVAASYDKLSKSVNKSGYGKKPYSVATLSGALNMPMQAVALHIAIQAYITEVKRTYAVAIDQARSHYGKYSTRRLQQLRSALLVTSLDLPSVAKDTAALWSNSWGLGNDIKISAVATPGILRPPPSFDLVERLGKNREYGFSALLEDDSNYREILSVVSSLGANVEAGKLNRRVLTTALITLLVAASTLAVTSPSDSSILFNTVNWIKGFWVYFAS